jgi:hypothetical protein
MGAATKAGPAINGLRSDNFHHWHRRKNLLVMKIMGAMRSLKRPSDRCRNITEHVINLVPSIDVRSMSEDDVLAELDA